MKIYRQTDDASTSTNSFRHERWHGTGTTGRRRLALVGRSNHNEKPGQFVVLGQKNNPKNGMVKKVKNIREIESKKKVTGKEKNESVAADLAVQQE